MAGSAETIEELRESFPIRGREGGEGNANGGAARSPRGITAEREGGGRKAEEKDIHAQPIKSNGGFGGKHQLA